VDLRPPRNEALLRTAWELKEDLDNFGDSGVAEK